jgi:SAM-dependent methyltransferase
MLPVKLYSERTFFERYVGDMSSVRVLNAGSAGTRYGTQCLNVDIQAKAGVDRVADLHELPDDIGQFDVVVCNAVLQYCVDPARVAREFFRVLEPGGYLYVDAPWVQSYCPDTPDRFRYSEDALRAIFADFDILELGPAITPGSAFAMLGVHIAQAATRNRYLNFALGKFATVCLYPFRWIKSARPNHTAGAFYLVAQKPRARSDASTVVTAKG